MSPRLIPTNFRTYWFSVSSKTVEYWVIWASLVHLNLHRVASSAQTASS